MKTNEMETMKGGKINQRNEIKQIKVHSILDIEGFSK